ncbi:MAG: sigma-54-dependent Fis family transcriptional regulator [Deltaproteobacteria bacterium]|nr:sigma-54-dependent Fis family transcriptional regulator [Deltaproteobacteria bacterium]
MANFLIVDDNQSSTDALCALVARRGHEAFAAYDGEQAMGVLGSESIDVLVTDLRMPRMDGMALLAAVKERWPEVVVIVVTAHGSVEAAVEAMKIGAFDFVTKPLNHDELQVKFQKAVAQRELSDRVERLDARVRTLELDDLHRQGLGEMIGGSEAMRRVYEAIEKVAPTDSTVLILGESGTGKELVARAIHQKSARSDGPFVGVHCAAYAQGVLESELFGHERGAFTGAQTRKIGRFELADRGTFFLDEVGDIPMPVQTKLLRVIQEREFERVGGTRTIPVDARLVAATNKDLQKAIADGTFREDLFYRLNIFAIQLPALRERKADIPMLTHAFIAQEYRRLGHAPVAPSDRATELMMDYDWPGNVRELRAVIERAAILADGKPIDTGDLPPAMALARRSYVELPDADVDFDKAVEDFEKRLILHAYEKSGGVKAQAAKMLGIDRNRFRYKLEKLGIDSE